MKSQSWSQRIVLGAFGALAIACGGGGGGGGGNPESFAVSYSVTWGDRSRVLDGRSAALSMTLRLSNANAAGGDLVHSVNRDANPAAYVGNYVTSAFAFAGTYSATATFYSQANGAGSVVAVAQANLTVNKGGALSGAITTVSEVASVTVAANQTVNVGEQKDLTFTARDDQSNVIALSPGSAHWNVTSGNANLSFTNGTANGIQEGPATVTATVDGVVSPGVTVNVLMQLDNSWMIVSSDEGGDSEVARITASGTNYLEITNDAGIDFLGRPNPLGTQVVFESTRNGTGQIFIMNVDGSNVQPLTSGASRNSEPAFSRDGTKIVFTSERDGNLEIYVMDANGANQTRLTNHASSDYSPRFNHDGTRIIFISTRDGDPEVWTMDTTGGDLQQLTTNTASESYPSYSADGTKILFGTDRDGNEEIYSMNPNGSSQTNLTNNAAEDIQAHFNAAGTLIAFASNRGGNYDIFTMNATGGNQSGFLARPGNQSMPNFVHP